jgi:hypothetical protein
MKRGVEHTEDERPTRFPEETNLGVFCLFCSIFRVRAPITSLRKGILQTLSEYWRQGSGGHEYPCVLKDPLLLSLLRVDVRPGLQTNAIIFSVAVSESTDPVSKLKDADLTSTGFYTAL